MRLFTPRAGRWPLALTFAALAALGACADEPVGPKPPTTIEPQASAQTIDPVDVTVTNASGGTEVGSLRWAASQMTADGGVIHFDPGLAGDTITLGAELYLDYLTVIDGPADKGITLSGNDQHRVILANQGIVLRNVTVTKGNADYASGIYSGGTLHMEHSTVQDNRGSGAAVFVDWRAWVTIVNSTITGNEVGTSALRYANGSTVQLYQSTIANNSPGSGLSMSNNASETPIRVFLQNSIISNNGAPLANCATTAGFQYQGMNISSDYSCGNTAGIVVLDPLLMPLADNGGPTMTHAISHRSPALNAGESCSEDTDQRYVPRDTYCDVGAFEFTDFTAVTITVAPNASVDAATGLAVVTGTVRCSRNGDQFGLRAQVSQTQKVGKTSTVVRGEGGAGVTCTTSPQPWSATVAPESGAFKTGAAAASVGTNDVPVWVTPASVDKSVKLVRQR